MWRPMGAMSFLKSLLLSRYADDSDTDQFQNFVGSRKALPVARKYGRELDNPIFLDGCCGRVTQWTARLTNSEISTAPWLGWRRS